MQITGLLGPDAEADIYLSVNDAVQAFLARRLSTGRHR